MSTETDARKRTHTPINRLALALVDIFTGVTEAEVIEHRENDGRHFTLKVKKAGIQDG